MLPGKVIVFKLLRYGIGGPFGMIAPITLELIPVDGSPLGTPLIDSIRTLRRVAGSGPFNRVPLAIIVMLPTVRVPAIHIAVFPCIQIVFIVANKTGVPTGAGKSPNRTLVILIVGRSYPLVVSSNGGRPPG